MIETKEQYDEYNTSGDMDYSRNDWAMLWANDIRPTIEALREVARPLDEAYIKGIVERLDRLMKLEDGAYDPNVYAAIAEYLRARRTLPRWLTEANNQ